MTRLFAALAIPDTVAQHLMLIQSGVPGARWQEREQLHLTLRFIGDADGRDANAVRDALSSIRAPAFTLQLKGAGSFGAKHPNALWVGVAPSEPLLHLQRKVDTALRRVGLAADERKFTPHVTLARLRGTPPGAAMDWITDHALFASTPFDVDGFILYSSILNPQGSRYRAEQAWRLTRESA